MKLSNHYKNKRKKAFSLAEMLVSLGTVAFISLIFFNALIIAIKVGVENSAKSNLREELTTVTNLILTNFRTADLVLNCTNSKPSNSCTMEINDETYRWYQCEQSICLEIDGTLSYQSSAELLVKTFSFEKGFISTGVDTSSQSRQNILVTIIADHSNKNLEIENIYRQISASTRNYEL